MTSTLRRSSNGSVTTTNGGRSSSQISIYDYPEHLNPFYEDDNHKRIRFWKLNSSNKTANGRDRSNSFSLNALKEMWAFKSFRLKKRSSTLGINKTSESPPQLRRNDPDATNGGPLFDGRIRHTVNGEQEQFRRGIGYRSSLQNVHSNNGSTTTMDASGTSTMGFNRNDRYRSTIQNGYQTTPPVLRGAYVHSRGSVTPTPTRSGMGPGVSQSSLNSTNPFEDDDDDEDNHNRSANVDNEDNVSRVTAVNVGPDGEQQGTIRKVYRKKRRAPPPPPPRTSSVAAGAAAIAAYQSEAATTSTAITTVPETSRENSAENEEDISQLAAQIASFVRTADTAEAERLRLGTPENDRDATSTTTTTTTSSAQAVHIAEVHRADGVPPTIDQPPSPLPTLRALPSSARDSPENNAAYPDERTASRSSTPSGDYVERRHADKNYSTSDCSEKQLNTTLERAATPRIVVRSATTEEEADHYYEDVITNNSLEKKPLPAVPVVAATASASTTTTTTTSTVVRVIDQPRRQTPVVHSLHIAESTDDLSPNNDAIPSELTITEESAKEDRPTSSTTTTPLDPQRYKMAFVAVKSTPPKPEPITTKSKWTTPWSSSTSSSGGNNGTTSSKYSTSVSQPERLVPADRFNDKPQVRSQSRETTPDEMPAPPRRRRSVKDIIESINKCQSLLRINQTADASSAVDQRVANLDTIDQRNNGNNNNVASLLPNARPASDHKTSELVASEQEFRESVNALERQHSSDRNNNHANENDDVLHQLPIMVERYAEFSGDFKMCNASSPSSTKTTTTTTVEADSPVLVRRREKTRTDWNPLPKPRRSRNLTQEATASESK